MKKLFLLLLVVIGTNNVMGQENVNVYVSPLPQPVMPYNSMLDPNIQKHSKGISLDTKSVRDESTITQEEIDKMVEEYLKRFDVKAKSEKFNKLNERRRAAYYGYTVEELREIENGTYNKKKPNRKKEYKVVILSKEEIEELEKNK